MGLHSIINDPFSWKDWFNAFLAKVKGAGPHKIPDSHIRFMNHAFIAGWNSRGTAEDFLRTQKKVECDTVIKMMNDDVIKYFKEVEADHNTMDDIMKDLKQNPEA